MLLHNSNRLGMCSSCSTLLVLLLAVLFHHASAHPSIRPVGTAAIFSNNARSSSNRRRRMFWCVRKSLLLVVAVVSLHLCSVATAWSNLSTFGRTSSVQTPARKTGAIDNDDDDDVNINNSRRFLIRSATVSLLSATALLGRNNLPATAAATATIDTTRMPLPNTLPINPPPILAPLPDLNLPQFFTVDDVPVQYFEQQRYIYGYVERVIDGDTIRVRHIPGYGLSRPNVEPLQQRGIAKDTLSIRVYGVDTPEIGKNKRSSSQPFAEEAKQFTTNLVFNKMVKVTLLKKDQYNRAIACVETVPSLATSFIPGVNNPKDLSVELAREGLAELYTGGGAVYFDRRAELEAAIRDAQRQKKGQWSLSPEERQSAAARKREMREGAIPVSKNIRGGGGGANNKLEIAMTGLELVA